MINNKKSLTTIIAALTVLTVLSGCGQEAANSEFSEEDIYVESDQTVAEDLAEPDTVLEEGTEDQAELEAETEDQYEEGDYGEASYAAVQMILEAMDELKEQAQSDPVRLKEITPEPVNIEVDDDETGEDTTVTRDVCTIELPFLGR